jgi:protein-disulfide isomerase
MKRRTLLSLAALACLPLEAVAQAAPMARSLDMPLDLPDGLPVLGVKDAPNEVVLFTDHNCPVCRSLDPPLLASLAQQRDIRLRVAVTPIISPASREVARVVLGAHRLGRFEPLHSKLMAAPGQLNGAVAYRVAAANGYNREALETAAADAVIETWINAALVAHRDAAFRGVPILVTRDQVFTYGYDSRGLTDFSAVWAAARKA